MAKPFFDATQHDPQQMFDPVPAGWYPVQITKATMKDTSDKSGSYLELDLTICDGQYANRKGFGRITRENANDLAVRIGNGQLSAICHAIGVLRPQSPQQLVGTKPLMAKFSYVDAIKNDDGSIKYEPKNEIKGYKACDADFKPSNPVNSSTSASETPDWVDEGAEEAKAAPAPPKPETSVSDAAEYVMTEKAAGASYESFVEAGWTDEQMLEGCYMEAVKPVAPTPPTPPKAPKAPKAPAAPAATGSKPPWEQ